VLQYPANLTRKDPLKAMLDHAMISYVEENSEKVNKNAILPVAILNGQRLEGNTDTFRGFAQFLGYHHSELKDKAYASERITNLCISFRHTLTSFPGT
jgi:hypothetical protein